jgi:hypothetical protein
MRPKACILSCCILFLLFPPAAYPYHEPMIEYSVVKGDTLIGICTQYLEYPKKWREIAKINGIENPDRIHPGEVVRIPLGLLKGTPLEGEVTFKKGDINTQTFEGRWVPLDFGAMVPQGSVIKTGEESAVEVTYEDVGSFFLRPQTELGITSTNRKGISHIVSDFFLKIGKAIIRVRDITGRGSRYKVQTPSSITSARGTEFRVNVDREETTRTEALKGSVEVEARGQRVYLKDEEGTLAEKGKPPIAPRRLLPPPAPLDMKPFYKSIPLRFTFAGVSGASALRVMLVTDREAKDVLRERVMKTSETFDIHGLDDGTYYLLSQSIDDLGLEGSLSELFTVRVRVNPLPPYTQSPSEGDEIRDRSVECRWLKVRDAARYHLQLAEDKEFIFLKEESEDVKGETYKIMGLDYRSYFFRVSSIAEDGYEGAWSGAVRFTLIPPPPSPPLEKPEMGKDTIRLRWHPLGEGFTYRFQMARDEEFQEILYEDKLSEAEATLQRPKEAGTYYVRTSAIDKAGYEGEFSPPQSFEIERKFPYAVLGVVITMGLIFLLVP